MSRGNVQKKDSFSAINSNSRIVCFSDSKMSADTLTTTSRNFYEHTKSKMGVSLFLASMAMMALGFSAAFGGQADNANWIRKNSTGDAEKAAQSLVGGFGTNLSLYTRIGSSVVLTNPIFFLIGFACFSFLVAFFIFLAAALYISPAVSGSAAEKKMISKPDELEGKLQNTSYLLNRAF